MLVEAEKLIVEGIFAVESLLSSVGTSVTELVDRLGKSQLWLGQDSFKRFLCAEMLKLSCCKVYVLLDGGEEVGLMGEDTGHLCIRDQSALAALGRI